MTKFKLPVTHVVTVEDKEVGETKVYELCTQTKATWAITEMLKRRLDAAGVVFTDHSVNALAEDALATYGGAEDLHERGLIFSNPDETGP